MSQVITIAFNSALSTLAILDRQARKDTAKVYRSIVRAYWFLSSPAAMQTYRAIYRFVVIIGMIAIALATTLAAWIDRTVEEAQQAPTAETIEPAESTAEPATPAPMAEHAIVPFIRKPKPVVVPSDADLVRWAKQNRSALPGLKVSKWSYARKLRESERSAVLAAMEGVKRSA